MLTVIGAGLPRTGTTTLKSALTHLREGPCHHMSVIGSAPQTFIPAFTAAAQGHSPDWDETYAGYVAAVDWPTSAFWPELIDHYPNATVILSLRDTPQDWVTSMRNTIIPAIHSARQRDEEYAGFDHMVDLIWDRALNTRPDGDHSALVEAYNNHCQAVRERVPAHRLLEWNARDGWEPLCQALNVPLPDTSFPHLNTTADFNRDNNPDS